MEKKRSNSVITTTQEGSVLKFNVLGAGELSIDLSSLSTTIQDRAMAHGMKQRISDAAALSCNPETGKPATAQEKYEAMKALVDHYNSGADEWNIARSSGGIGRTSNVLQAIANVYKLDVDGARAYVEKTAVKRGIEYKAALALWKQSDKIVAELARMATAAPTKINADDLLDEME